MYFCITVQQWNYQEYYACAAVSSYLSAEYHTSLEKDIHKFWWNSSSHFGAFVSGILKSALQIIKECLKDSENQITCGCIGRSDVIWPNSKLADLRRSATFLYFMSRITFFRSTLFSFTTFVIVSFLTDSQCSSQWGGLLPGTLPHLPSLPSLQGTVPRPHGSFAETAWGQDTALPSPFMYILYESAPAKSC